MSSNGYIIKNAIASSLIVISMMTGGGARGRFRARTGAGNAGWWQGAGGAVGGASDQRDGGEPYVQPVGAELQGLALDDQPVVQCA